MEHQGSGQTYKANAFAPQTQARLNSGTLRVTPAGLRFESPTVAETLPLTGLVVRRGGHNNEQVFFEHPEFPGWSIYSSDPALSKTQRFAVLRPLHVFSRRSSVPVDRLP